MKTGTKLTLASVTAIALVGFGILASMLRHGLSARDQPTAVEAALARSMRLLAMPRAARTAKNPVPFTDRSEEHTSELQSQSNLVCRLLLEKKKKKTDQHIRSTKIEKNN